MFSRRTDLLQLAMAFFCACFLASTLFVPRVSAATDPITLTTQTATETFPAGIDFQVNVQDAAGSIAQATLILSSSKPHYIQVERNIPIATPQQVLTLHWHEATADTNTFIYPGTVITYKWRFHDNANHWHAQDQQSLTVIDNRFNWQHLTQGLIQVNWYSQSTDFGQVMLKQAVDNVKRISSNLGGTLLHPINLWVYQTPEDFRGSLPPSIHEWVGGIAFPVLNQASVVVDSTNADTLVRDMPHELTHLIFHQLIEQGIFAPLWFDEGMAMYNQIYREPDITQRLNHALSTHTLLRLNTISYTFPADADTAYLAYAQSWNLIEYMYTTFGKTKMVKLIALMNGTTSEFNEDVKQALGEDIVHLENQWRVQLHQPSVLTPADMAQATPLPASNTPSSSMVTSDVYAPLFVVAGLLLILLPIVGLSGAFVYQRRRRHRDFQAQQAQRVLTPTFPAYSYPPYLPVQQHPPQVAHPTIPFESYGDVTMPPVPHSNSTQFYTNPSQYMHQSQQFPHPPAQQGQDYMKQMPSKQAPQE